VINPILLRITIASRINSAPLNQLEHPTLTLIPEIPHRQSPKLASYCLLHPCSDSVASEPPRDPERMAPFPPNKTPQASVPVDADRCDLQAMVAILAKLEKRRLFCGDDAGALET
jgi:hypothetical protein